MAEKKVTTLTREERVAFIERAESDLPLTMQTELLNLNRSSFYYQPRPARAEEVVLKHRIDEVYTQSPFYGARKIAAQLQREGMGINRKTVGRSMQEMDLAAIYLRPNLSKRTQKERTSRRTRQSPETHQMVDVQSWKLRLVAPLGLVFGSTFSSFAPKLRMNRGFGAKTEGNTVL